MAKKRENDLCPPDPYYSTLTTQNHPSHPLSLSVSHTHVWCWTYIWQSSQETQTAALTFGTDIFEVKERSHWKNPYIDWRCQLVSVTVHYFAFGFPRDVDAGMSSTVRRSHSKARTRSEVKHFGNKVLVNGRLNYRWKEMRNTRVLGGVLCSHTYTGQTHFCKGKT